MGWFDENAPDKAPADMDGRDPGSGRNIGSAGTPGGPAAPEVPRVVYTQQNPYPDSGKPVPGMPGFVYNWAGGMEPVDGTPNGPGETTNENGVTTATGGANNASAANYDGYAKPGYVPTAKGGAPSGWDQTKWANESHQTPKYVVGKILSNYADTPAGLQAAMADIQRAYPGATLANANSGKVTLPGVGTIDVGVSFGSGGGRGWAWNVVSDANGNPVADSSGESSTGTSGRSGASASNYAGGQSGTGGINGGPNKYQSGVGNYDGWEMQFESGMGAAPVYQPLSPWSLTDLSSAAPFQPESFVAPTDITMQNDPGYQFRLKQGLGAIENSAASKGALHTPNVIRGLNDYAQDYASSEFGNVWNRDFNVWNAKNQTNMSAAQFNEANRQGIYGTNQNNQVALRADATNQNANKQNSVWNAYNTDYTNARDRYLMAYDAFRNNQGDNFDRNYRTASLGVGAT